MADPKPGTFRYTSRDEKAVMRSRAVRSATSRGADRGIAAFRSAARVPGGTGQLSAMVRKEPAVGRDGRPGHRIVAYSPGNLSALFGTKRSKKVRAVAAAVQAIKRGGR
ncbi:hypothetical protein CH276_14225 [Rhodococcus sp. 06-470-2]|uniref:hypothetical protein n=1 Tax=unclassified Rhodococcus (in: high G+C Gram-positive bacteria) TaxID=192944 RepID=UPI000B9B010E|nr:MULTISPECIES: hypothetical protein [unclassified Rhodococcus (in: high G+C Gram-positive bacteria)]OZC62771.1 hypothetical protein CH276_14225 [Rhodococcus sp. 06-470-2]OZE71748.1 hypothetical protein CH265_01705 [Rhodococcus sp. 05-2221-1B]